MGMLAIRLEIRSSGVLRGNAELSFVLHLFGARRMLRTLTRSPERLRCSVRAHALESTANSKSMHSLARAP